MRTPQDRRTRTSTGSKSWFKTALRNAELEPMTIHDLRHTAASLAVSAGANVKAVQRMLGHASAAMTLDVYSDLFDDDLDAVSDRLDQAVATAEVSKMCPSTLPLLEGRPNSPGIPGLLGLRRRGDGGAHCQDIVH